MTISSRNVRASVLSLALGALLSTACSDSPGLPTTPDGGRIFSPTEVTPTDGGGGGDKFSDLYRDLFASNSAARCQNGACHGPDVQSAGFNMGEGASGAYSGLTTHKFGAKPLVAAKPGGDARPGSSLFEVIGTPADPTAGFMPRVTSSLKNRKLTKEELARVDAWLARGAPFD